MGHLLPLRNQPSHLARSPETSVFLYHDAIRVCFFYGLRRPRHLANCTRNLQALGYWEGPLLTNLKLQFGCFTTTITKQAITTTTITVVKIELAIAELSKLEHEAGF